MRDPFDGLHALSWIHYLIASGLEIFCDPCPEPVLHIITKQTDSVKY